MESTNNLWRRSRRQIRRQSLLHRLIIRNILRTTYPKRKNLLSRPRPSNKRRHIGTTILDLYTGEQIMYLDGVKTDLGQALDFESPNEHGLLALTWSITGSRTNGTWIMYDAYSGRKILTVTNVTSGSEGPQSVSTFLDQTGTTILLNNWNRC